MKSLPPRKPWLLVMLALGLVLAFGLQWIGAALIGAPANVPPAPALLSRELPGWQVTDHPLADSPEEKAAEAELLNFDDAVFRIYKKGGAEFGVYVAHWKPGRMSPRLIDAHTPDVCWPDDGWIRRADLESNPGAGGATETAAALTMETAAGIVPGQFRIFEGHDTRQRVLFWHVNGDQLVNYGTQFAPPWYAPFTDLLHHGLKQRNEQWFVRISSSVPFSLLAADPGFQAVLTQLSVTGLKLPPTAKP